MGGPQPGTGGEQMVNLRSSRDWSWERLSNVRQLAHAILKAESHLAGPVQKGGSSVARWRCWLNARNRQLKRFSSGCRCERLQPERLENHSLSEQPD